MKIILSLALLTSSAAFAGPAKIDLIKNNLEVKSAIAAFEANRGLKCNELNSAKLRFSKTGGVKISVLCNHYDKNGDPTADVYFLTFGGALYPTYFDLSSIVVTGAE